MNHSKEAIHPAWLRVAHWANAPPILLLVTSGWRIYNVTGFLGFHIPAELTLAGPLAATADTAPCAGLALDIPPAPEYQNGATAFWALPGDTEGHRRDRLFRNELLAGDLQHSSCASQLKRHKSNTARVMTTNQLTPQPPMAWHRQTGIISDHHHRISVLLH